MPLLLAFLLGSCSEDLPTASSDLWQTDGIECVAGDAEASVTWTPSDKRQASKYLVIWEAGTAGVEGGSQTVETGTTTLLIEGLENGVSYTISVQVRYANGLSGKVSATVTPKSTRYDVTDLKALSGSGKVRLEWTKPLSDKLTGYTIEVNPDGKTIEVSGADTEKYLIEGLTNGTEYTFTVTANYTNGKSDGTYTVEVSVTYTDGTTETGSMETTVNNYSWETLNLLDGTAYGYVKVSTTVFSPDGTRAYIPTSTPNGNIFAFGVWTGTIDWMYAISTVTYGGGCVVDASGNVYQCGTDKKVYAITSGGVEKWTLDVDGVVGAFPAVTSDGTLYCLTNGSTLYAINTSTGTVTWSKELSGSTASAVAVDASGNVYAGTYTNVYAFTSDGTALWTVNDIAVTERGAFAIHNGTLYAALRSKAGVAAINMADGKVKWKYGTSKGDCYLPVTDADGTVYFTEKSSQTVFSVTSSGTIKWSKNVGCNLTYTGIVLADNGNLYFGTQGKASDGSYKVFGLSMSDGSVVYEKDCDQQIMAAATIDPDKRLYIGTVGSSASAPGRIMAFDINASIAQGCWSVHGGDLQGTNSLR